MEKKKMLSVNEIAYRLGRCPHTVLAWVRWQEAGNKHPKLKLPPAKRTAKNNGREWDEKDFKAFEKFKFLLETSERGALAEYNAKHFWGKRGKRILDKKNLTK